MEVSKNTKNKLIKWYHENKRDLPWRLNRDPYRIWISEVMLQQTLVNSVIQYFTKFIKAFPTVQDLAQAKESDVFKYWAGLGYYSRARNLHKSAQILAQNGFSKKAEDLVELPGFGPYTSRAVSSLSFGERVGVLDGNVIRVLTRFLGLRVEWWTPKVKNQLQALADDLAKVEDSSSWNQALMELGATICTPQKPACLLCPISNDCKAQKRSVQNEIPLAKPRREKEVWIWSPHLVQRKNQILVIKNNYAPFLKNSWILPGEVKKIKLRPKEYLYKHMITHHEIYVVNAKKNNKVNQADSLENELLWIENSKLKEFIPYSLVQKYIDLKLT